MYITDSCAECKKTIIKFPRYGCRVCFEKTGREGKTFCSERCVETHKSKVHNSTGYISKTIADNHRIMGTYERRFAEVFKVRMGRFMHPLFGFDVIAFDDWVRVPEGVSLHDEILKRWGREAEELICQIVGVKTLAEDLETSFKTLEEQLEDDFS
jgi:hypothetical protein